MISCCRFGEVIASDQRADVAREADVDQLLAERLATHIPATPERLERFLIPGFLPTGLHPLLKTLSAAGSVCRDSMLPQKPVRSHPLRPMLRG